MPARNVFLRLSNATAIAAALGLITPGHLQAQSEDDASATAAEATCNEQRMVLSYAIQRFAAYRAGVAGIDAKIEQLQAMLERLRAEKARLESTLTPAKRNVKQRRRRFSGACKVDDCTHHEGMAAGLYDILVPLANELTQQRTQVNLHSGRARRILEGFKRLARAREDVQCRSLDTSDVTQKQLDACMRWLTQWQQLNADFARLASAVPEQRRRYEQTLTQLRSLEARAERYAKFMTKKCAKSPSIAMLRTYEKRRQNAEELGAQLAELDKLLEAVDAVRAELH